MLHSAKRQRITQENGPVTSKGIHCLTLYTNLLIARAYMCCNVCLRHILMLHGVHSFRTVVLFIFKGVRTASVRRKTNETSISVDIDLDGTGKVMTTTITTTTILILSLLLFNGLVRC
jgi:hypothetical protein